GYCGFELCRIVSKKSRRVLGTVKNHFNVTGDEVSGQYAEFTGIELVKEPYQVLSFKGTGRELKEEVEKLRKIYNVE
ncbi:MAG: hypothetical protein ACRCX2_37450, partial [Paraclostridium sp.]